LKKRVFLFSQEGCYLVLKRWDPVGVSLVHFPRGSDEFVFGVRVVELFDVHELPLSHYEITPSFLPVFSNTPSARSSISSVWVAM